MKNRYQGPDGERRMTAEIGAQRIVLGDKAISRAIADAGEPIFPNEGDLIIEQGASTDDVFMIIAGEVEFSVNGRSVGLRSAGRTVGEISAINPRLPRTADVRAKANTVLLRVPEPALARIGDAHPVIWRRLAADLGERLEERNASIRPCNERPRLFIICSSESIPVAEAIQQKLDHGEVACEIWSDSAFRGSEYPLEALDKALDEADFTVAIASPDDLITSRGATSAAARDNVMVELGMSIRSLGRRRSMILIPRGAGVTLPSDFKGLIPLTFENGDDLDDLPRRLGPACTRIKAAIRELGVRVEN